MKTFLRPLVISSALALAIAPFFSGCGNSTEIEQVWVAPELKELSFQRILVVVVSPDETSRRLVEDETRKFVTSATVIQSYTVLPADTDLKNIKKLKSALAQTQADGLIVVRPLSDATQARVSAAPPPVPYRTLNGYWGGSFGLHPLYNDPVVYTDRIVQVETNIYDAASEKLVWSGTTETRNPGSLKGMVGDVVTTIREQLRKEKLIP